MLVSIIIPIYNVAPYIEQCLNSVMHQTYRELEVLLVDDCGTDDSIAIVKRMLGGEEDAIIDKVHYRILHHEHNRGLSAARNTGIDAATGEWLFFLDSDDWISEDCIALLKKNIDGKNDVDMVMGEINIVGHDPHWGKFLNPGVYMEGFIEMACSYKIYTMAWNRLISKKFIVDNTLYFEEGLLHEDVLWNMQTACMLHKLIWIQDKTYYYRIRQGSIQTTESKDFHKQHLGNVKIKMLDFVFANGLDSNITLFNYIYKDISQYMAFDGIICKSEVVKDFYKKFKSSPNWTFSQLKSFEADKAVFVLFFCRKMPEMLGLYLSKGLLQLMRFL